MQYFTQVHCSMVMYCIIIQEVKEEIILRYTVQEEDTQNFTQVHYLQLHYSTRSKRVNKEITLCFTVRRKTSFYAKFQVHCSHCLPVSTWLWPAL